MRINKKLKRLIEENALAIATINKKPHISVCGYAKVQEDKIVITVAFLKKTVENIKKSPDVALAVWNKDWKKGCIGFSIFGKAKFYSSGKWMDFVKNLKENEDINVKGAIIVLVNKVKNLS